MKCDFQQFCDEIFQNFERHDAHENHYLYDENHFFCQSVTLFVIELTVLSHFLFGGGGGGGVDSDINIGNSVGTSHRNNKYLLFLWHYPGKCE